MRLSYESWDSIFDNNNKYNNKYTDVDSLFNSFHNTYLRIFYTSFPIKTITKKSTNHTWLTTGIKISCKHKKYLYLLTRNNEDANIKNYYKQYCKILTNFISFIFVLLILTGV